MNDKLNEIYGDLSKLKTEIEHKDNSKNQSQKDLTIKYFREFEDIKNNNLSGFEFLSCIPGTVGGGIKMNAGCFGKEFKDILLSVQAIDKSGNVITIPKKAILFDYRKNNLSSDLIFLSASFKGKKSNSSKIKKEMNTLKAKKNKNQPTKIKTSGSTFKNPIDQTKKKFGSL